MPLQISTVVFDARDAVGLAVFWAEALGWVARSPDDAGCVVVAPNAGVAPFILLFIPVPEPKRSKNRMHVDVNPIGADADLELARLLSLGARSIDVGQDNERWHVLADPEGNEFCLLHHRLGR